MLNKIFTLRISQELFDNLRELAIQNQRSKAGQIRWLIANASSVESIHKKFSDSKDYSHISPEDS